MDSYSNRYSGIFRELAPVPCYPHDPAICFAGGLLSEAEPGEETGRRVGGCGWSAAEAMQAAVGEGIERFELRPPSSVHSVVGSFRDFPIAEPAADPADWVLFSAGQHATPGFPFEPLTAETVAGHVAFRRRSDGSPIWVPEALAYLLPRKGEAHRFGPATSTGLSAETDLSRLVLRGAQEWIERDGTIGAWWGVYEAEEWPAFEVLSSFHEDRRFRILRPNLTYRFFRIVSPFSENITVVLSDGADLRGRIVSFGSACRETLSASWRKALLESLQTRVFVRALLEEPADAESKAGTPRDFASHAAYYSRFPERLPEKIFPRLRARDAGGSARQETFDVLEARLGPGRPILFRLGRMEWAPEEEPRWLTARVLIPGLLVLHGDHRFPHLGSARTAAGDLPPLRLSAPHPFA